MASLEGKVFAITGGASGMGLATCKRLVSLKARAVCIGDFNSSNFEEVTQKLKELNANTEILTTKLDVSSSASVNAWYDEIIAKYSALDGVVNCAGLPQKVGGRTPPNILEETDEMWERIVGVNLNGIFYSTRAATKAMVALPKSPRSIVNIGSISGILHSGGCYAYGTSKRAVVGLTPAFAKDLTPFGIRVNGILPCESSYLSVLRVFLFEFFVHPFVLALFFISARL